MTYPATRHPLAERNPLRSLPLYKSARSVFGSSARDKLVGNVRRTVQFRDGLTNDYAKACADLCRANHLPAENRRCSQATAMRRINAVRVARLANLRAIAAAEAALAAFDADPEAALAATAAARKPVGGPAWGVLPSVNPERVAYVASGAEAQGVPFLAWLASDAGRATGATA